MEEVIKFLNENRLGNLATVENGEPRVRPWGFVFEEGRKFFFCTANTKDIYKQLKTTPFVEFVTTSSDRAWVRLRGEIAFCDDLKVKEKALKTVSWVESLYKTADNPIFEVFYIEHGSAMMDDFTGQPCKNFKF
ncbi:MAG TPA: pyridoxamine 5'-phosphate oxidase family protein [Desulfosporosinus sp.]|nr:pyridoxamine 5'-phosphate oxidase family protein [Desulfosporosinus sp.]